MIDISRKRVIELLKDAQVRSYAAGGVLILASLVYISVFVVPIISRIGALHLEISDYNNKIMIAKKKISQMQSLSEKQKTISDELKRQSVRFADRKEITALLEDFAKIASNSEVKILSITPNDNKYIRGAGDGSEFYTGMPITITAKTGYHQLGSFVGELEASERLIRIDGINIHAGGGDMRLHDTVITLKTYVTAGND
ncbi:MAG: type 4a pilus biogenesis protein PilO [Candidatus Omnitrophica bacterium]|nr:type 4a pilus biogenesis protein PilO [Candidatus Omnitrophota bacterium]